MCMCVYAYVYVYMYMYVCTYAGSDKTMLAERGQSRRMALESRITTCCVVVVVVGIMACSDLCALDAFQCVLKQNMHLAYTRRSFVRNMCFA